MIRSLAVLSLILAATPSLAAEMTCDGALGPKSTLADIEKAYGKANVITGDVDGPEGTTMVATTVFPNDDAKTFQIYWFDEEKHERVAGFTIAADATGPGGVKIGMPIKDVQKINGGVFQLSGFYWDYGGNAGFDTGKLSNLPGGCHLNITFNPSVDPPTEKLGNAISGEKQLKSNMKEFDIVKPVVQTIDLGYVDDQAPADDGTGDDSGDAAN